MPNLNGYEMSKKIKNLIKDKDLEDIPIISYSSCDLTAEEIQIQKSFMIDKSLTKPSSKAVIQNAISQLLPHLNKI